MKRFNFRLQNLLHLRESLEKMQGANLGHAEQTEGARRATAEASDHRLSSVESQAAGGDAPRAAGLWHSLGLSVEAARVDADHAAAELRAAELKRAEELERYNEARGARRVLEKLRERREADHDVEVVREERREMDEQVIARLPNQGAQT